MPQVGPLQAYLVAVDFSACSLRALDMALGWRQPGVEVTVLHVLDTDLARRMEEAGVTAYTEAITRMRARAERELAALTAERGAEYLETMIVEGSPFVEIVKIANDLDCDLVFIGIRGSESGLAEILFGSTAERVLRAARQPVVCVP